MEKLERESMRVGNGIQLVAFLSGSLNIYILSLLLVVINNSLKLTWHEALRYFWDSCNNLYWLTTTIEYCYENWIGKDKLSQSVQPRTDG